MGEHRPLQLAQRLRHAADHALGEGLGLGDGDVAKAEAGVGGKLALPAGSSGGPGNSPSGRFETMDLKPSAARLREVAGLQRAGDGKMRGDVNDPVHGSGPRY